MPRVKRKAAQPARARCGDAGRSLDTNGVRIRSRDATVRLGNWATWFVKPHPRFRANNNNDNDKRGAWPLSSRTGGALAESPQSAPPEGGLRWKGSQPIQVRNQYRCAAAVRSPARARAGPQRTALPACARRERRAAGGRAVPFQRPVLRHRLRRRRLLGWPRKGPPASGSRPLPSLGGLWRAARRQRRHPRPPAQRVVRSVQLLQAEALRRRFGLRQHGLCDGLCAEHDRDRACSRERAAGAQGRR